MKSIYSTKSLDNSLLEYFIIINFMINCQWPDIHSQNCPKNKQNYWSNRQVNHFFIVNF